MAIIFDLDQTLIDSSLAESHRNARNWQSVYSVIPKFRLYDGISEVLEFIAGNKIPYAIVTSSPSTYCNKVCAYWKFQPSHIIGYHDTSRRKPHHDPITLALQRMIAKPENSISFGDRDIDIVASKAAFVKSVACFWGTEDRASLLATQADFAIENPIEIIEVIKKTFGIY